MPSLRYSDAAKADLIEIARFIARDKPEAARRWAAAVRAKCRLLAGHPHVGDDRSDLGVGVRAAYIGHFIIFFRHHNSLLEIIRVRRGDLDSPFDSERRRLR